MRKLRYITSLAAIVLCVAARCMAQNDITIPSDTTTNAVLQPLTDYTIYDPGGTAKYPNNCNGGVVVASANGEPLQLFGTYVTENNRDKLYIYDGASDTCTLIGTYSGTGNINIVSTTDTLLLVFVSNGSSTYAGFALNACACSAGGPDVHDVVMGTISGVQAKISWSDNSAATVWTIYYGTDPYNLDKQVAVSSPHVTLRELEETTTYYFRIYNNAISRVENGICGAALNKFATICPSNAAECVNFTDLYSCHTTCRYGSFGNPDANTGVIDHGSSASNSRHTVHTNTNEYDTRTGDRNSNRLRTVPQGEIASVRLGNWQGGGQAESITYEYYVDTTSYDLLVLKYAAVLEQPGHGQNEQPRFDFKILDTNGREINSACYSAVFIPGYTKSTWHSYRSIMWKDWTTIGIDLGALHGQRIYIKLTTKDCVYSAHYGYAYFTLTCDHRTLTSSQCGFSVANTFTAPDGFSYRWYNDTNSAITLSTDRSLSVTEEGSYSCFLSYGGGAAGATQCGFTMKALAGPRFPYSIYDYEITDTVNCLTRVQFHNHSYITTDLEHTQSTGLDCEEYSWIIDGQKMHTEVNPYHDFEEGWHTVQLVSKLSCGACTDTATKRFYIGAACWVYDTADLFFCDTIHTVLFDSVITTVGSFTRDSANHTHTVNTTLGFTTRRTYNDTIVEDLLPTYTFNGATFGGDVSDTLFVLQNVGGCDSLLTYNLMVCRHFDTVLHRIECDDAFPIRWFDGDFSKAGVQHFTYKRYCKADSNVVLRITTNPTYKAEFYDTICDNFYSERSGHYFNLQGRHRVRLSTINDCDSSEYLNLIVNPTYDIIDRQVICSYDSLVWQNGVVYHATTHTPKVTYPTIDLCDSNVILDLTVQEPVEAIFGVFPNSATHQQREIELYDYSHRSSTREWYVDDELVDITPQASFVYPVSREQVLVMLIAIDTLGCRDTAYRVMTMDRECVWMPNIVTPELPANNRLRILHNDIDQLDCTIYNRNGHFLYRFKNMDDEWDCTYRGDKCPQGVYVYIINYTPKYNPKSWYTLKGTFTIVR